MRFYTDPPFRYVEDGDGVTWCYNPDYGIFINITFDRTVSSEEVPEKVRNRLLSYTDDDELDDEIEQAIKAFNEGEDEPPRIIEDQKCQDFVCGAAPLGCSDPRYCPRESPGFEEALKYSKEKK